MADRHPGASRSGTDTASDASGSEAWLLEEGAKLAALYDRKGKGLGAMSPTKINVLCHYKKVEYLSAED